MGESASGPNAFFKDDHRACDAVWSQIEAAIDAGDNARAKELWEQFDGAMQRHFRMEEEVMFPAFEEVTGMHSGPTAVMRMEHTQMRALLDQMRAEAERGDFQSLVDHGDTLLMLTQQHNAKEEGVLYPMADQALGDRWALLAERLKQY